MSKLKIARQAYRKSRQTDLLTFAEHVYKRMKGSGVYAALQDKIEALAAPIQQYAAALAAARNRGLSEVLAKNLIRRALIRLLDALALALEDMAGDQEQLFIDAGFSVAQEQGLRFSGNELPAPQILRIFSTGIKGEIRVSLRDAFPKSVRTHAAEFSPDRGQNWKNGVYNSNNMFTITGLPREEELWIRIMSLGNGSKKSAWSQPVVVSVL